MSWVSADALAALILPTEKRDGPKMVLLGIDIRN